MLSLWPSSAVTCQSYCYGWSGCRNALVLLPTSVLGHGIHVLIGTHGNSWGVQCMRREDSKVKGVSQFKVRVEEVSQER